MDRKLPNELPEQKIKDFNEFPKVLEVAMQNEDKYIPVTLIEPGTERVLDSFFIRFYKDPAGKYLQLQEFKNVIVFNSFKEEFGDKAEVLEGVLGFRLKF